MDTRTSARTAVLDLEPFTARPFILTDSGRSAIRAAAHGLNLHEGAEVLLPAYCCGVEITSLRACGVNSRLVPIGRDLVLDPAAVRSRIGPRTRALYVIHYLGHPQPLADLRYLADRFHLRLIEDCALALLSQDASGRSLGMTGDAAIFSFTKFFPWIHGGALVGALDKTPSLNSPSELHAFARRARRILAGMARRAGLRRRSPTNLPAQRTGLPDLPAAYYPNDRAPLMAMARVDRSSLRTVDVERERHVRRARWNAWNELFQDLAPSFRLRSDLEPGATPLFYPLVVEDRASWLQALHSAAVPLPAWWLGSPPGIEWSRFPDALTLKRSVLAMPVDPSVPESAIEHLRRLCFKMVHCA